MNRPGITIIKASWCDHYTLKINIKFANLEIGHIENREFCCVLQTIHDKVSYWYDLNQLYTIDAYMRHYVNVDWPATACLNTIIKVHVSLKLAK